MSAEQGIIYSLHNLVNGKYYIGQTVQTMAARWNEHKKRARNGSLFTIHKAIRKYGPEMFEPRVLVICPIDLLDEVERLIITEHRAMVCGYNMVAGGRGCSEPLAEVRARMSQAQSGKRHTEESRQRMSRSKSGRQQSFAPGKTGYRGVALTAEGKYRAYITHRKKTYRLGHFHTAEDAALAYNAKAVELYGDNAILNKAP
jgi:group I intron endonuclease